MGQPVTQILLDTVGEKGPVVSMLNSFPPIYLYEQGDDVLVGDHYRRDVLLRLRSDPSPYPSAFTFALCRCTLHVGDSRFRDL